MFDSHVKLSIESKLDQVPPLGKAIRGICSCAIEDEETLYQLELCAIEAITNVINHAYHRTPGLPVDVDIFLNESQITIRISDSGEKSSRVTPKGELDYDPEIVSTLPESGMGLFLINKFMDQISYLDNDEKNVLVMKKHLAKK